MFTQSFRQDWASRSSWQQRCDGSSHLVELDFCALYPLGHLWTAKYANNRPVEDLIRVTYIGPESLVWNAAKQHKNLIQQHSFWKVTNDTIARFWEDSSQQQHRLKDLINPHQISNWEACRLDKINQYWKPTLTHGLRQWVNLKHIIGNGLEVD